MKPSNYIIPGTLKYRKGNALFPETAGVKYIVHVCNDIGFFAAGFALAIAKRWPKVKEEYNRWFKTQNNFKLGEVQYIQVQSDMVVVNMIAQHLVGKDENGGPCIRYESLEKCLDKVGEHISKEGGSICSGRFGSGLAGGSWNQIEKIIKEQLIKRGINVTIYDLE